MKTIFQETALDYNRISIQDAITLLPLMNYLKRQAELEATETAYKALSKEERAHYKWVPSPEIPNANAQYRLLVSLGFCSSTDEPIESHLEDYKKPE